MRVSAVQAMKKLAAENFKLKDAKFNSFEKIDVSEVSQSEDNKGEVVDDLMGHIEVWADMTVSYEGEPPESYRVLNSMIMDWVDDNEPKLKKLINSELVPFLKGQYPNIDTSDLKEDFDDYIWEDQVDYMPVVKEDDGEVDFTLEIVLEVDEEEVDDVDEK